MPSLLKLCEKYFGKTDIYEVLNIPKTADEKQVRKAYHKHALLVHPDRVDEKDKAEATEKFKVLGKIHSILSDQEKRAIYDESGDFDEEGDEVAEKDWREYWRMLFKPITEEDISNYEKKYKGSEEEAADLKQAYLDGKGDMDYILETVPFTNTAEEPRIKDIIQNMIDSEEVPSYTAFTNETPRKRERRKRKWEKEAQEAAKMKEEDDLVKAVQRRQQARAQEMDNFLDTLAARYGKKTPKAKTGRKKSK